MGQNSLFVFSDFSNTNITEKTVGVSGIQTWIVGVEGDHHHGSHAVYQNTFLDRMFYEKNIPS